MQKLSRLVERVLIDKTLPDIAGLMNVHHLELFYYVARHGGIMPAVRNIPYGIQQLAVSSQIAQLEEFLGATLFHRRPFVLTPEGEKLYELIRPFFFKPRKDCGRIAGRTGAVHPHRRLDDCVA
jgi:DNA-binding transcriptional LysR family regulator